MSNQRSGMTVGRVVRVRPRSVKASIERNRYMGWWRDGSVRMTVRMAVFPMIEIVQRQQKGMEIQMWEASNPGMPVRMKQKGSLVVFITSDMLDECKTRICVFCNKNCISVLLPQSHYIFHPIFKYVPGIVLLTPLSNTLARALTLGTMASSALYFFLKLPYFPNFQLTALY